MTPSPVVLSRITLYRYELPLSAPLELGEDTWDCRRGLLLKLETEQGVVGWGEAAPLPGFSPESLEDVIAHARMIVPEWSGTTLPESGPALEQVWETLPLEPDAPASFRFAADSALVELLAAALGTSSTEVLGTGRSTVALNALITKPLTNGPAQAAQFRKQGYRAVKVKVGRGAMELEVDALREIRRVVGEEIGLRVDANRAWSLAEAVAFAEATSDLGLAYVEEPLADPSQLSTLTVQTDLPVALDETTREVGSEVLQADFPVAAVVLKPTLLGLRRMRGWCRTALEHGVTPVLSAAYESGIGLRTLVALAAAGPDVPVGLSTYDRLADDVLHCRLPLGGPEIDVSSVVNASTTLDENRVALIDPFSN